MQSPEASLTHPKTALVYQNKFLNKEEIASVVFEYKKKLYYGKRIYSVMGCLSI